MDIDASHRDMKLQILFFFRQDELRFAIVYSVSGSNSLRRFLLASNLDHSFGSNKSLETSYHFNTIADYIQPLRV